MFKKTIHDIEYDIDLIEEKIRSEFALNDNWYGDCYGSLLEDRYGNNLKTEMELAKSEEEYNNVLKEIELNFREDTKGRDIYEVSLERGTFNNSTSISNYYYDDLESAQRDFDEMKCRVEKGEVLYLMKRLGEAMYDVIAYEDLSHEEEVEEELER